MEKAARTYFGKPASKLTVAEAALLAGLVQSPVRYDPYKSKRAAKDRRDTVLGDMQSLGYITAKQAATAKASPVKVRPKAKSSLKGCANATSSIINAGFFCAYATLALRAAGFPQDRLETGGLRIYTTLNPKIQNSVQRAMPFDTWANRKSVAVTDIIQPKTGQVLAFGVSRRYGVNPKDRNVTSNPLNTALTAGAGSTYKLFTLVSALQAKVPLEAFQISVGNTYTSTICKNGTEPYVVQNAGTYKEGPYNLDVATYESVNTFFVALLDQRFNCDLTGPVRAAEAMGMDQTLDAKHPGTNLSEGAELHRGQERRVHPRAERDQPAGAELGVRDDRERREILPADAAAARSSARTASPDRAAGAGLRAADQPRDRAHGRHGAGEGHQQERRHGGERVRRAGRRAPADRRQDRHRVRLQAR